MTIADDLRPKIDADINSFGVFLLSVSEGACTSCGTVGCIGHADRVVYHGPEEAFVYTIGQHTRQRPEIVVMCGPMPTEDPCEDALVQVELRGIAMLINHIVKNWETKPLREQQTMASPSGRRYLVLPKELVPKTAKETMTVQAANYYGHDQYDILVAIPTTPLPRHKLTRH